MAMYPGGTQAYMPPNQPRPNPLRRYYPRLALVVGGVLVAISTVIPWVSVTVVGGINLWRLYSMSSQLGKLGRSDTGYFDVLTLFIPLGVLLLGVGAVLLGALTPSRRMARTAASVAGGMATPFGIFGLITVIVLLSKIPEMARGAIGMNAGAFVLLIGGLAVLSGAFVPARADHDSARSGSWLGPAAGYTVSAIGVILLVVSLSVLALASGKQDRAKPDAPTSTAPSPTQPDSAEPTTTPDTTTSQPEGSEPSKTVDDYFDAINDGDYHKAWKLGGKNLNDSYDEFKSGFAETTHDTWTTKSADRNKVTGVLKARESDGTTKVFQGNYTVEDGTITDAHLTER